MALLRFTIVLIVAVLGHPVAAEARYDVMTVLDGNKLGLSVYNLHEDEASVIALDSTRSSILRVSLPLSQSMATLLLIKLIVVSLSASEVLKFLVGDVTSLLTSDSVVERISGSVEGKSGYHDGRANEALFDHPRKLTLDSDGNIYVADPKNGAVRMITKTGLVMTIAGGSNRTGHSDGEGSDVTFSNDFEVTYLHSTCTLAVADRGNRMIREIQLPQFIGRCKSSTAPNSPFTSATLLMFLLAGIAGIVVGVLGTIFTISTPQLERWQSRLVWATPKSPSWARSSIWRMTMQHQQEAKQTSSATRSSVTRNEAVEHLGWSPALFMEIAIILFEKFLYVLLYSVSLLLCSLSPKPGSQTRTHDLLGLHENQSSTSRISCTMWMGSLFTRWPFVKVNRFQQGTVKAQEFLILEDLIDFSEADGSMDSAPASCGVGESTDVVCNEVRMDSMVEKCLAELAAPLPRIT